MAMAEARVGAGAGAGTDALAKTRSNPAPNPAPPLQQRRPPPRVPFVVDREKVCLLHEKRGSKRERCYSLSSWLEW
jgi:hypothetical protein